VISPGWRSFLGRFAIALLVVVLIAGAGVAMGKQYETNEFAKSRTINISNGILVPVKPGKPANYLLIGSDSRAGESLADVSHFGAPDVAGGSDVMMVLHVEPASKTGVLVSFPRDLVVNIPGHGTNLLNATYTIGGPNLVLQTIKQDFNIPINHYIEIGFKGFRDIVNAIGHIHVWFPTPAHDPYTGLEALKAGCLSLNGDQALAYARSRHYYVPDDLQNPAPWQWNYQTSSGGQGWLQTGLDTDRIPRQQYFLRTISQAVIDKTGNDPTKIPGLLNAVFKNFAHDQTLKVSELNALALSFYGLNPARVQMETLPNAPATGRWVQHLVVKYPEASLVLAQLKAPVIPPIKLPIPLPQSEVTLRVVNGSGIPHIAAKALGQLTAAGFKTNWQPQDASQDNFTKTQIRVAPGKSLDGYSVGLATGSSNVVDGLTRKDTQDADVLVIVGKDWDKLQHNFNYAISKSRKKKTSSSTTPTSATSGSTPSTPSTSSTTTTTQPSVTVDTRFVPVNHKTGGPLVGCQPK
jgi:LCP family protein required for cell wall assembly